jgi:CitB family two-component system sensor histidine kinase MalK
VEERSSMLQSVREGVLAIDRNARITLVNEEAARIFNLAGIEGDLIGKPVSVVANSRLKDVLETGDVELDQEQDINGVVIMTNRMPIVVNGVIVGAIATFRDMTEIRLLAEELTGIRNYAEALRAQTHEFMNKLHVILGMVRMECFDEIGEYISGIAQQYQKEVGFVARRIKDPVMAGFLLGKLSRAREVGVELELDQDSYLPRPADPEVTHELITIVGNLVDNAMEALEHNPVKRVEVYFDYMDGTLILEVLDTGPGIPDDLRDKIFSRGFSTKPGDRGLGLFLVKRSLDKLNGEIEITVEPGQGTQFRICLPYEGKGEVE